MSEQQETGKKNRTKKLLVLLLLVIIAGAGVWYLLGRDSFRFDSAAEDEQGNAADRKCAEQPLQHEGADHTGSRQPRDLSKRCDPTGPGDQGGPAGCGAEEGDISMYGNVRGV